MFSRLFLLYFSNFIFSFQVVLRLIYFVALELFEESLYISQLTSLQHKETLCLTRSGLNLMKVTNLLNSQGEKMAKNYLNYFFGKKAD